MTSIRASVTSLMRMFEDKAQEFNNEVDNVHMVWLEEIQQEANRMFSRDFNAEPELMPKTPSQKKNSRRKRVSSGRQEESQARRRFSKGRRSNLRGTAVKSLNLIDEEGNTSDASTSTASSTTRSKRPTRKKKQTKSDAAAEEVSQLSDMSQCEEEQNKKPKLVIEEEPMHSEVKPAEAHSPVQPPPELQMPDTVVSVCSADRLPAELPNKPEPSPGRSAAKIAIAGTPRRSRSSKRCSLKLRHSVAGLRHSMTQESVRRSSHRSMLKRKAALKGSSTRSNSDAENTSSESAEEKDEDVPESLVEAAPAEIQMKHPEISLIQSNRTTEARVTRSMAINSPALAPSPLFFAKQKISLDEDIAIDAEEQPVRRSSRSIKRKATETAEESPSKRQTPPKKSQAMAKPHMKSFLHTVQKNQMLMMTPGSLSRTAVIKSFIKSNTPLKTDPKAKERQKLEALKKKQEQEEERMKKMEEEKRKKQEELKRKRDERLRRVIEAKVKEEQKEEEKKKRIEQKMAQIDEKNDKRLAEEKAKKKVALKRQEELELKKKLEEEAKKKKLQQAEEEKRQQELLAQKKAEEEELRARKLAEARRALELEQERERERERAAAAERARVEKEKLLALQREVERAAREKELREQESKRKALEEKRKLEEQQRLAANEKALKEREAARQKEAAAKQISACLNTTVDIERSVLGTPVAKAPLMNVTINVEEPSSPQSYVLSPKGGNKPTTGTLENYGMDQNSDDSTDDESAPKKRIPSWAQGLSLQQAIMKQYFNPPDLDSFFGAIKAVKLEEIFDKKKPRYFKRTSSAVWHSPLGAK